MGMCKYVVEGANFVATIAFDDENCGDPYMEAATRVVENVFGHGPDSEESENFNMLIKEGQEPALGFIISICKEGEIGDDSKLKYVSCKTVAKNAGLLNMVRFYDSIGMP